MAMTQQDRAWHETYEQMDPQIRATVGSAVAQAKRMIRLLGLSAAEDDRAKQLVAAVARYVTLSNPHIPTLLDGSSSNRRPAVAAETKQAPYGGPRRDEPTLWQEAPQYRWEHGSSLYRADDDDSAKVAGAGGAFDGGGASGNWDTTPSETNPPTGD